MLAFAPSLVTLGFALASLAASQITPGSTTESERLNFTTPGTMSENGLISETMGNSNKTIMSSTMSYMNATTPQTDLRGNTSEGTSNETTPPPMTTPKIYTTKMTGRQNDKTKPYARRGYDTAGIVILIVIIAVAIGLGIACFISRRRARRYAVDFSSRVDEASVPLSPVEPMLANDSAPHNGLQTFERSKEEEKEEATTNVEEDEAKAEAESASLPEDDSQDKDAKDAKDAEPVKPNDPDQQMSDGTVEESPKNENNSNNSDMTQRKDFKSSTIFWEISLNSPV
ncbi:uncharacterized protein si:dkey-27h10.2 isoform X2 [Syngnathus acus]|uniref:uncharacterized protein si:dkey-27h10.2 isoform X2 n=1 Tax=Syngnathus acus TaxID=161584 RepID=UPI0018861791|nr:uncharacterized protein si:dkey-27h10.2 isoform X2 [Syngnathus acus]